VKQAVVMVGQGADASYLDLKLLKYPRGQAMIAQVCKDFILRAAPQSVNCFYF